MAEDRVAKKELKAKEAEYDKKLRELLEQREKLQAQIQQLVQAVNQLNTSIVAIQGGKQTLAELLAEET